MAANRNNVPINDEKRFIVSFSIWLIIATLCSLVPAMIEKDSLLSGFGFLLGTIVMFLGTRNWTWISYYYIVLLINSSLTEVTIPFFSEYTVTNIIYLYFSIFFLYKLTRKNLKKPVVSIALYLIWMAYQIVQAYIVHVDITWFNFLLSWGLYLGCFEMQNKCAESEKNRVMLLSSLVVSALVVCCVGYMELLLGHTFFYSLWTGAERYRLGIIRVGSTLADPNFLCLVQVSILLIIQTNAVKRLYNKRFLNVLSIFIVIQCLMTASRTGIFAMLICFAALFVFRHRATLALAIPIIVTIGLFASPILNKLIFVYESGSAAVRFRIIGIGISLWSQSPLFGIGYGAFGEKSFELLGTMWETMNTYIQQLVGFGLVGLALYILYFAVIIWKTKPIKGLISRQAVFHDRFCVFLSCISWLICSASLDTFSKVLAWLFPAILISVSDSFQLEKVEVISDENNQALVLTTVNTNA